MNEFKESYLETRKRLQENLALLDRIYEKLNAYPLPVEYEYSFTSNYLIIKTLNIVKFKEAVKKFSRWFGYKALSDLNISHAYKDIVYLSRDLHILEDYKITICLFIDYQDVPKSFLPKEGCEFKKVETSYSYIALECPNE